MFSSNTGSQRYTSNSAVGKSGKPIRVFNITNLSGATAGKIALLNGTSVAADPFVYAIGIANGSITTNFEQGLLFPSGCFYEHDANSSASIITYRIEI